MPENLVAEIDKRVEAGEFKNRSDAIKTIIILYEEREKTREFLRMLQTRSDEAREKPNELVPLEEVS